MSSLRIKNLGEFGFIEMIKSRMEDKDESVLISIGDDAALIKGFDKNQILVTSDLLIEGVDFSLDYFTPSELAYKALACNISDISAMGGKPSWYTISLGIHQDTKVDFLLDFYQSLSVMGRENQISLIGGDLSDSDKLTISITLLGLIGEGKAIKRAGARPGDNIWLSGGVGFSSLGLFFLHEEDSGKLDGLEGEFVKYCIDRQKRPPIRSTVGCRLARAGIASSMIDISDGLFRDLGNICKMSDVGSLIDIRKLPRIDKIRKATGKLGLDFRKVISLGEDFELLFTVHPSKTAEMALIREEFSALEMVEIGKILNAHEGMKSIFMNSEIVEMENIGFDHFIKDGI
ncbi:thiamine-phosphate kinase [bacterium]|nr:thiamine-phosphate kinase [bacterium]